MEPTALTAALARALTGAESEVGADVVRPGVLALVVVLALAVATALLMRSFVRQLRKIDFEETPEPPAASPSQDASDTADDAEGRA